MRMAHSMCQCPWSGEHVWVGWYGFARHMPWEGKLNHHAHACRLESLCTVHDRSREQRPQEVEVLRFVSLICLAIHAAETVKGAVVVLVAVLEWTTYVAISVFASALV